MDDMAKKNVVCVGQDVDVDFVIVFVLKSSMLIYVWVNTFGPYLCDIY